MEITQNTVAMIDYQLTDDAGKVLDSTEHREPLPVLFGHRNIIPGLESALSGKRAGDAVQVSIPPEEAYGSRNDSLRQQVDRSQFSSVPNLAVGMQFRVPTNQGQLTVTVVDLTDDTVTVDGNHPLAGATLHFDVHVREVRNATEQELAHGHAHGVHGHDH